MKATIANSGGSSFLHNMPCLSALVLVASVMLAACGHSSSAQISPPRLTVVVVVDQLRGDEVADYAGGWTGGLHRLTTEGVLYAQGYHTHGRTETAAGHATIGTGVLPQTHGIVDKSMYLASLGRIVGVCGFGHTPCTPEALQAPTLGDRLKAQYAGAKVVSLAEKARSATLMGGYRADIVAWQSENSVGLVGRTANAPGLPPWLTEFHERTTALTRISREWRLPELSAGLRDRPDAAPGELDCGHGLTFPHRLNFSPQAPVPVRQQWQCTPESDLSVVDTALLVAQQLQLNTAGPNLLWVSLAATDIVGHSYGYESLERAAVLTELDQNLGKLMDGLEALVGKNLVVGLTADHGVGPKIANARAAGLDAGKVPEDRLVSAVEAALANRFGHPAGDGHYVAALAMPFFHFTGLPEAHREEAAEVAAQALRLVPNVHSAWTMRGLRESSDPVAQLMRASVYPERSGDVAVVLQPYYSPGTQEGGATHGSPWAYDRHVPVVLWGNGIAAGRVEQPVAVIDLMRTLADKMGLPPDPASGHPLPAPPREIK